MTRGTHLLRVLLALVLLNGAVTFHNIWPTLGIHWPGELSAELALLLEATGGDASRIAAEIEKLKLFAGPRKVTAEDIAALVANAQSTTIFALVAALGRGDRKPGADDSHAWRCGFAREAAKHARPESRTGAERSGSGSVRDSTCRSGGRALRHVEG